MKVRSCCVIFDFSNDNTLYLEEKDIKRKTLMELINFLELPAAHKQCVLTDQVMLEVARLGSINLFRTPKYFIPPSSHFRVQVTVNGKVGIEAFEAKISGGADADEEAIFLEESWPHIQIVYELLLRFLIQP